MMRDDPEPRINWKRLIGASAVAHALVLGGAVMLASGSNPRMVLYAPSMSVNLLGPGDPKLPPGGAPASEPPPRRAEPEKPKPAPKAEPAPPPVEKSKVKALKPEIEESRPAKKAPPKKPQETVRVPKKTKRKPAPPKAPAPKAQPKKPAPAPKPEAASAKSPGPSQEKSLSDREAKALARIRERLAKATGEGTDRRGAGGGGGAPGGGAGVNVYKNEIARIFYKSWVLPQCLVTDQRTTALVIHIDREGRIIKTEVDKLSGDRCLDESVMRAVAKVQRSGGLPPLPPEYTSGVMVQGLLFDPKIRRGWTE